jgi:putative ABC transport system permease protein
MIRIALRNVLADARRTALLALSVFVSCFLLLAADGVGNGAGSQLLLRQRDTQSGDVAVYWKNVLEEVDPSDPGRLLFSAFDGKQDGANRRALSALDGFLDRYGKEVTAVYRPVRAFGTLDTGELAAYCMILGVGAAELSHLERTRVLELVDGFPLFDEGQSAYVSEETAGKNGIWVGDYVTLDCATPAGLVNTMDFRVTGVYRNGAPWDNIAVYLSDGDARRLMEWDAPFFGSARIYLRDPSRRAEFARLLDGILRSAGGALRAEPSDVSSAFWASFAGFLNALFAFFTAFLLVVIAFGIRSTIRMSLFQRIQEFGTLRAVGFSRPQCLLLVFTETFLVSVFALAAASAAAGLLVLVLGRTGVYAGTGAVGYMLGGAYVYPLLRWADFAVALALIASFALAASLGPGLHLVRQTITDLLARNPRRRPFFRRAA